MGKWNEIKAKRRAGRVKRSKTMYWREKLGLVNEETRKTAKPPKGSQRKPLHEGRQQQITLSKNSEEKEMKGRREGNKEKEAKGIKRHERVNKKRCRRHTQCR